MRCLEQCGGFGKICDLTYTVLSICMKVHVRPIRTSDVANAVRFVVKTRCAKDGRWQIGNRIPMMMESIQWRWFCRLLRLEIVDSKLFEAFVIHASLTGNVRCRRFDCVIRGRSDEVGLYQLP